MIQSARLQKENVIYMEIRFAPLLHTRQGLNSRQVVDAVISGMNDARRETGTEAGIIVCAMRHHDVEDNIQMLHDLLGILRDGSRQIRYCGR